MANANERAQALQTILDCYRLCLECARECTDQGGKEMARCIKLCHACAEACLLCVRLLTSEIPQSKQACQLCADLCDACAAECENMQGELMRQCAESCRKCADTCRRMAA
jgi:hypothetical protein